MVLESIGALILFFRILPIYRAILFDPESFVPDSSNMIFISVSIILIQGPHWYKSRNLLFPNTKKSHFLDILIGFAGRIFLIIMSALFTIIFFARIETLEVSFLKILVALLMLLSIYCYVKDLEELADSYKRKKIE
jgi:hypothetical protein